MPHVAGVKNSDHTASDEIAKSDQAALSTRALLIESALTSIASNGLDNFSLRSVSAAIGRSTTTVFQHFGGKDGLLAATIEVAFEREASFHAEFLAGLSGLVLDAGTLTEVVAQYVEVRAVHADAAVRIWPELLFNGGRSPFLTPMLVRWRQMREEFWKSIITSESGPALAILLADYTVMEGAYAVTMQGRVDYRLLVRETAGNLVSGAFGSAATVAGDRIRSWMTERMPPAPLRFPSGADTPRGHLLDVAAAEIFTHGVVALNHRRLTAKAGVSTAMIAYHFGDMNQFAVAAIWHALLKGLPSDLDNTLPTHGARQSLADWWAGLSNTLASSSADRACGFYVSYSRIVGQTCLLARGRSELVPLAHHLRMIEGLGTHHASRTSWPPALWMGRGDATAFAIWIKGWAITAEAGREDGLTPERLQSASHLLNRQRHQTTVT